MIYKENFRITQSAKGFYTVRWRHNNAAIKSRLPSLNKASNYIKWIVGYLNKNDIQVKVNNES